MDDATPKKTITSDDLDLEDLIEKATNGVVGALNKKGDEIIDSVQKVERKVDTVIRNQATDTVKGKPILIQR